VVVGFRWVFGAPIEVECLLRKTHKVIVALTVREILDEQIAKKLV